MGIRLLLYFGFLSSTAQAPVDKECDAEWKKLDGTWRLVQVEDNGAKVLEIKGWETTITKGKYTSTIDGKLDLTGNMVIAVSGPFNSMDLTRDGEPGEFYNGIYEVRGNVLRMCFSKGGRPRAFTAPAGSGRILLTLTRVKK